MSNNQLHGKKFEDLVKACGLFDGAADHGRRQDAGFDIEARFDRRLGIPTSVKSTCNQTICLADARRFWGISCSFRMLVGRYEQDGNTKVFYEVLEFLVHGEMFQIMRGAVSFQLVEALHNGMSTQWFPKGSHEEAREWVEGEIEKERRNQGIVKLNRKIDSKTQRRMQCSVLIRDMITMAEQCPVMVGSNRNWHKHDKELGVFDLPLRVKSGRRKMSGAQKYG